MKKLLVLTLFYSALYTLSFGQSSTNAELLNPKSNNKINPSVPCFEFYGDTTLSNEDILKINTFNRSIKASTKTLSLDSIVAYKGDKNTLIVTRTGKTQFLYTNDLLVNSLSFKFSQGQYIPTAKWEYGYNTLSQVTTLISFTYNESTNKWENGRRRFLEYDSQENITKNSTQYISTTTNSWVNDIRDVFAYDSLGNEILKAHYYWDISNNSWFSYSINEASYNASGIMIEYKEFTWDYTNGVWLFNKVNNWWYNVNGELYLHEIQQLDVNSNTWIHVSKTEVTFDTNNREILQVKQSRNMQDSLWTKVEKIASENDSLGNNTKKTTWLGNQVDTNWNLSSSQIWEYGNFGVTSTKMFTWDTNSLSWNISAKHELVYNIAGDVISNILFTDSTSIGWLMASKNESQYNGNHTVINFRHSLWNASSSAWILDYEKINAFNINNQQTLDEEYILNQQTGVMEGYKKNETVYNSNLQVISYNSNSWLNNYNWAPYHKSVIVRDTIQELEKTNSYLWNTTNASWELEAIDLIDFDLSVPISTINVPSNFSDPNNYSGPNEYTSPYKVDSTVISWSNNPTGTLYVYQKGLYYYSEIYPASTSTIVENKVTIFPNPFSDNIKVSGLTPHKNYSIQIFNIQGSKMMSTLISNNELINTSNLASGVYIYRIIDSSSTLTGKIIKR